MSRFAPLECLNEYWDQYTNGAPPRAGEEPALAASVRRLHALDDSPAPDPAFADRLWEVLAGSAGAETEPVLAAQALAGGPEQATPPPTADAPRPETRPAWKRLAFPAWGRYASWAANAAVFALWLGFFGLVIAGLVRMGPPTAGQPATPATAGAATTTAATAEVDLGKVAFVREGDIWVKDLPEGEERRLTSDGVNAEPKWSPSGEWLAFRKNAGELWLLPAGGGEARALVREELGQFAWSPVSDHLAFSAGGGLTVKTPEDDLVRVIVPARAERGPGEGEDVASFAWSADGRRIAIAGEARGEDGDWSASLWWASAEAGADETGTMRVWNAESTPEPSGAIVAGWSPDGKYVLYWAHYFSQSLLADGAPLHAVAVEPGGEAQDYQLSAAMLAYRDFLAWSPDGGRLAFVDGAGRGTWENKTLVAAAPGASANRLSPEEDVVLFPAWSPDGCWLAYSGGPATPGDPGSDIPALIAERGIQLVAADGGERRALSGERDERPLWSADGQRILFVRVKDGAAGLYLMQADGTGQQLVVDRLGRTAAQRGDDTAWSGYYGYVDWAQEFDWWQPPLAPTQSQTPSTAPVAGDVLGGDVLNWQPETAMPASPSFPPGKEEPFFRWTSGRLALIWEDNSDNEDGFRLEIAFSPSEGPYRATTPANVTSHITPSTDFGNWHLTQEECLRTSEIEVRLWAFNEAGESEPAVFSVTRECFDLETPASPSAVAPAPAEIMPFGGYVDLAAALRAAGARVEPAGVENHDPLFGRAPMIVEVILPRSGEAREGGGLVQVYQFTDEAERLGAAAGLGPGSFPTIEWVDEPHFWAKGRVIVQYVGQDEQLISLLTTLLGPDLKAGL